jgi:hypothetical protein
MDKKTRTTIIIGGILTFIIVPLVTAFIFSQMQPKPTPPVVKKDVSVLPDKTDKELLDVITTTDPSLTSNGEPSIAIMSTAIPEKGWYVVTVRQIDDVDGENPAKILLHDSGAGSNSVSVLLGPGTDFPDETTQSLGIPDKVLAELNK